MRTYTAAVTFGGKQFTDTETEVIAARGHSWGAWTQTKAPTCTAEGEEQRICANDPSHTQARAVDELGHDRIRHEAKAPTCTEIGWEAYDTCSRCGETETRVIPAEAFPVWAIVLHVLLGILLVGGAAVLVIVVKRKKQA